MQVSIVLLASYSQSDKLFVVLIVRPVAARHFLREVSYVAAQEVVQARHATASSVSLQLSRSV